MDLTKDLDVDEILPESTPMRDFYRGKIVFLTGGTGFLGQLYVEKLLRSEVKIIYLLTRPKKGKSPRERLREIFTGVVFRKLSKIDNNYLNRIKVIEGDVEKLKLGISEENRKEIVENCEIVLHAAADVRFDETLRKLLITNLRGTRELLQLAEEIKNLKVFSYISTAFSHCYRKLAEEKFYEPPVDPEVMLKFSEKFANDPSDVYEIIQDRIISPWPNTYTYTKSLCEELVRRFGQKFPICIIRPTVVIATHEDPIPAWCNNIYGLNGILVACGMGVLRLMNLNKNLIGDIVCADFVINSTLAAIWVTHEDQLKSMASENGIEKQEKKDPEIYHVCTTPDRPIKWGVINDRMKELFAIYPAKGMLWKHSPNSSTCPFMLKLLTIYYHVIPAFFFDSYLSLSKQKLRLMPVYRKVQRFMVSLSYFMTREFEFTNTNMKRVLSRMIPVDQEFYPSDVRRYNWHEYSYEYILGLRLYIGQEPLEFLEAGRKKYKKLVILHFLVLVFYYSFHVWLFYMIFNKLGLINYASNYLSTTYDFVVKIIKT